MVQDATLGRPLGGSRGSTRAYTAYYRENSGERIEVWLLTLQVLRRFVDTDRALREWRRGIRTGSGCEPMTSLR